MNICKKICSFLLCVVICVVLNPVSTMAAYDEDAAVQYARDYGNKRNSYYQDFENSGGDCTNFVSQCLYKGGLKESKYSDEPFGVDYQTTKWYHAKYTVWTEVFGMKFNYRTKWKVSTTWIRVIGSNASGWGLGDYLGDDGLGYQTLTFYDFWDLLPYVEVGDVIQLTGNNSSRRSHSIIVSGVTKDDIFFCSHTYDYVDKSLADLEGNFKTFYLIKVK